MAEYGTVHYEIFDKVTGKSITCDGRELSWRTYSGPKYQVFGVLHDIDPDRFEIRVIKRTARECVLDYLNSTKVRSKKPLYFISGDYYTYAGDRLVIPINIKGKDSLEDTCLKILKLAETNSSAYSSLSNTLTPDKNSMVNSRGISIETSSGRYRSSLDIWRHILSEKSDVTIFDVMHALYNLTQKDDLAITEQYCSVVHRRVFHLKNNYGRPTLFGAYQHDEYGLYLSSWRDI